MPGRMTGKMKKAGRKENLEKIGHSCRHWFIVFFSQAVNEESGRRSTDEVHRGKFLTGNLLKAIIKKIEKREKGVVFLSKSKKIAVRLLLYLAGLAVLALGLTLNTKVTLGVSPLISVAYSASRIWELDLGNTIFLWYGVFVLAEMLIHLKMGGPQMKKRLLNDLLQLPLSLVFTRFMKLYTLWIPEFETECAGSFASSLAGRVIILLIAIAVTGIGAALSLDMRIIPNPGDGVVQSLADLTGWKLGSSKNVFDLSCVVITLLLSLLASGSIVGVGLGTLLAMLGTGRTVALFNNLAERRLVSGLEIRA